MPPQKACHNCRRGRRRCDFSVPVCHKCSARGEECLGYGNLYRWTDAVASRGRMTGKATFAQPGAGASEKTPGGGSTEDNNRLVRAGCRTTGGGPQRSLVDSLFQDLDPSSRQYLSYYVSRFCADMVVYGAPSRGANPFTELVPLCGAYSFLRHIVIASSALHFSHATTGPSESQHGETGSRAAIGAVVDALRARQRALESLRAVLERQGRAGRAGSWSPGEKDALFATIVFFINFDLIDSGRGSWRAHMDAAARLVLSHYGNAAGVSTSCAPEASGVKMLPASSTSDLATPACLLLPCAEGGAGAGPLAGVTGVRDYLASDLVSYYIWAGALDALACSVGVPHVAPTTFHLSPGDVLPILTRTEANSYHSCPAHLLHTILQASRLACRIATAGGGDEALAAEQMRACARLLKGAQDFDVDAWAADVFAANTETFGAVDGNELRLRGHIAATYRATTCLYIVSVFPGLAGFVRQQRALHSDTAADTAADTTTLPAPPDAGEYSRTILRQLSCIPTASPLFKYTTWPVFMVGAETADAERRAWALRRLQAMWEHSPWGMLRSAMDTLRYLWQIMDDSATAPAVEGETWLTHFRAINLDCLII